MKILKSFVLLFFSFWAHSASAVETVHIAIGEWQPFLSSQAKHNGFASHIITESFSLQGINVVYGFFPWKRSFMLSREGKEWDGTAVWLHTEERERHFYFSEPVVQTTTSFFHMKGADFEWSTMEDLADKKLGVTIGYSYGTEFDMAVKNKIIETDTSPSDELNLQKIHKQRIDVFPGEVMVMYSLIREMFPPEIAEKFTHNSRALLESSQHLLLSKANPDNEQLMKSFDVGLNKLKDSGRYDEIIADGLAGKYARQ